MEAGSRFTSEWITMQEGDEMVSTAESANYKMSDAWDAEAMISPKGRVIEQTDHRRGASLTHDGRRREEGRNRLRRRR